MFLIMSLMAVTVVFCMEMIVMRMKMTVIGIRLELLIMMKVKIIRKLEQLQLLLWVISMVHQ